MTNLESVNMRCSLSVSICLCLGCVGLGHAAGQDGVTSTRPAAEAAPTPSLFGPRVPHKYWTKDDVAARQEFDAFTSLQDGQPAAPGDWELEMSSGWSTFRRGPDDTLVEPTLEYTPHRYTESGYELWESSQLSLRMPLQVGNGEVEGNGDMTFGWQERWFKEGDIRLPSSGGGEGLALPSFSTLAEVRMPTGLHSSGADGTFTGILAKDFGPGTTYFNGWVRSANGDNIEDQRPLQWGTRAGYKWRLIEPGSGDAECFRLPGIDRVSAIFAYNLQSSEQQGHGDINTIELAAEFRTKHHLAFGPGIIVGVDDHEETPRLAAGFRFVYLFNARNPPK